MRGQIGRRRRLYAALTRTIFATSTGPTMSRKDTRHQRRSMPPFRRYRSGDIALPGLR